MALSRATAASTVAAENAELFALLAVGTADTAGQLKEPLDAALRAIGTPESALATAAVADGDVPGFMAYLTWRVLLRLKRASIGRAKKIAATGLGVSKEYGDIGAQIDALIADAVTELPGYGLGATMATGAIGLDFVEPVDEEAA